MRTRRGNAEVRRYVASHLLAVISEWASLIGLLVYAFEHSGALATGLASLATLAPYVVLSSTTARLAHHHPPATVRLVGLVVQTAGYGMAASVALGDGPLVVAVAGVAVAFTAVTSLRPSGAVLLPGIVRSSRELTTANVRVGYCESTSVLVGPIFASLLLDAGGGGMVLAGCAGLTALAVLTALPGVRHGPPAAAPGQSERPPGAARGVRRRLVRTVVRPFDDVIQVARRPHTRGVLAASMGQYVLIGAFDIILVVIAGRHIDLGDAGAGILTACFGAGALASVILSRRAAHRPRLAPLILLALFVIATGCIAFGLATSVVVAVVALPVLGCSRSLLDLLARVLLQRSAPPAELARVFGALETSSGVGVLVGSLLAQILIALSGASAALLGVGVLYALLVVVLVRPLRSADDGADVPVVTMSLLARLPVFAPLPTFALEGLARSAVEVPVATDEVVIRQGDHGDRFYAVADGAFDVVMSGAFVRTARRGSTFGEVALLADVPRTATVIAREPGHLVAIDRAPFLTAVTGYDSSRQAAWRAVNSMSFDQEIARPDVPDVMAGPEPRQ